METADMVSHNIAQLGKLFPNCVSETIDEIVSLQFIWKFCSKC